MRAFCHLESVGSVPVLGIFYLTFEIYSPSLSTLFWPTFSSLKHGIKWFPVLWLLLGFGQWSEWWDGGRPQSRIGSGYLYTSTPVHPRRSLQPSTEGRCSCWAPVRQCFPYESASLCSSGSPNSFSDPCPCRNSAVKTSRHYQPQTTASFLLLFLNPAHMFVSSL